jgi:signal transduction histidine kinase/Tfp pilus assembly protein PilF
MMKATLFFVVSLFVVLSLAVVAEQTTVQKDASYYMKYLEGLEGHVRLKKISRIVAKTKQRNPTVALHYFQLGLTLLKNYPDDLIKSDIYQLAAWAYITTGEFKLASKQAQISLTVAKAINDNRRIGNANTALGAIALYQGDTATGLTYFKKALHFSELDNSIENQSSSLHNIAQIYQELGDLNRAIEYLDEARSIQLKQDDPPRVAAIESAIADLYVLMGNIDKAIPYYKNSITIHDEHAKTLPGPVKKSYYAAKTRGTLARAYLKQENFTEAQKVIQESISAFTTLDNSINLTDEIITSGDIYFAQKRSELAITTYEKVLRLSKEMKSESIIQRVNSKLADTYLQMGNIESALLHAHVSYDKLKVINNPIEQQYIEDVLSRIYARKGDFKKAYQHSSANKVLSENNRKIEISDKNEQTENRFQTAKKEKTIELLTKDNALQLLELKQKDYERNLWLAGFIIFILSTSFLIYRQKQKRKLVNERASLMAELVDKKNQLLADVSHELRTPLSVLHLKVEALQYNLVKDVDASYESLLNKIGEINNMISDIYQLAQSDIGALNLNIHPHNCLSELTAWSGEFSEIVSSHGFEWHQTFNISDDLIVKFDDEKIKQVLSNLIHNSIAYTDKPGKIALSVIMLGKNISIRIEDSSPGVAKEHLTEIFERLFRVESSRSRATGGSGLGLSICRSIIEAHNGSITATQSKLGGLAVTVKLPLLRE